MDLRALTGSPSTTERAAVDSVLGAPTSGWEGGTLSVTDRRVAFGGHATRGRRHLLLPALHAVQDTVGGISRGALAYICERLTIPAAEAYGVATFYSLFDSAPRAQRMVHLCDDIVCRGAGGADLGAGITGAWKRSPCLGRCDRAPAALVHEAGTGYTEVAPAEPASLAGEREGRADPTMIHQPRADLRLLRRVGHVDPTSLEAYQGAGGYGALRRAVAMGRDAVIAELERSGLRGRGGAAFGVGTKWRAVADAPGAVKYVVGNGDESEPGTFKDRVLMEADPFALVEGMLIAGFATGAGRGVVYVRGEYALAARRVEGAIAAARAAGMLGDDVAGAGFGFDVEVRRGAGAYICGEETALFASIEGYRGEPRPKPPYPTASGLFGRPTVVNNIESLAAVLEVMEIGGKEFAAIGSGDSTGPKLFCVSGDVTRPGVYEVTMGTPLRDLLELAGGVSGARDLGAVLLGGAAGSFLGPDSLDLPLTFEDAAAAGTPLGSGAVVVFDETTDFPSITSRIARFFSEESCGQCVPCRVGTVRQAEALRRLEAGAPLGSAAEERGRLDDLAAVMGDASICGLGHTASNAVQSALELGLIGVVP